MKILNKLTIKHLTLNKKRTITTILGICLSTALMVGIGLIFSTLRDYAVKSNINDRGHQIIRFENVDTNKLDFIRQNKEIKDYYFLNSLGRFLIEDKSNVQVLEVSEGFSKEITLLNGVFPTNNNEIMVNKSLLESFNVKVGESITLDVEDNDEVVKRTYKIVGLIEPTFLENYYYNGYLVYSLIDLNKVEQVNVYTNIKNLKKTYEVGSLLKKNLEIESEDVIYNDAMLSLHGISRYSNITKSMTSILSIVLALVSIGCIIVIYNSFAISVMERKKQFGLFASIGTTKKQLRYTVFFEALIVGVIGIILGLLGAYIGIGIVVMIVNNLLKDMFRIPLELSTYWMFVIVPVIFMVITILVSAYLPARRASKTSPISAIRQNDDIKISGKKVKTSKLIKKIFGIEGEIALKNIKRNKKKYRITIVSLFISIVLFISFSSLLEFGLKGATDTVDLPDYNIISHMNVEKDKVSEAIKDLSDIRHHNQVNKSLMIVDHDYFYIEEIDTSKFDNKFVDIMEENGVIFNSNATIVAFSDEDYNNLVKKYNASNDTAFIVNNYKYVSYKNSQRKTYTGQSLKNDFNESINICKQNEDVCNIKLDNIKLINEYPFGFDIVGNTQNVKIIVNKTTMDKIKEQYTFEYDNSPYNYLILTMQAKKYDKLETVLKRFDDKNTNFSYYNTTEELKLLTNLVLVVRILLYGFITLVTLIGVTSVFNTINTSINLRRKEFAVLRSIGLTPKGFNKMLYFESIFFGLKSLLYSIPASIIISYLIYFAIQGTVSFDFIFPIKPILIAVASVFIIVILTMMYSTSKIKHENILEAIREENI